MNLIMLLTGRILVAGPIIVMSQRYDELNEETLVRFMMEQPYEKRLMLLMAVFAGFMAISFGLLGMAAGWKL